MTGRGVCAIGGRQNNQATEICKATGLWQSDAPMRYLIATLALLVFSTSLVWAWELPCQGANAGQTVPAGTASESSPEQDLLPSGCLHGGHLTSHLLGQLIESEMAPVPAITISFEPPRVPALPALTDTPLRPPATRWS